jgi:cytochrome c peroxidase
MKSKTFILITSGILLAGAIIYSCTKENDLGSTDQFDGAVTGNLKAYKVKGSTLSPIQQLGKDIYFDKISVPNSMACSDCHAPLSGWTGPMAGINIHGSVYRGAVAQNFGNRKPPSAAYATFSPVLYYDEAEELFIGGNFWDGRATGERLGSPAAEQALGPFLNPAEHHVPSKLIVLQKIAAAKYIYLWEQVWGEPLSYDTPEEIDLNYDRVGLAIAEYEGSPEVNQFSSKFDYYLAGKVELSEQEAWGLDLFNDKGKCALCHISDGAQPLFTDFSFDNLGVPKNPENPVYKTDPEFVDLGLGGFLSTRSDYSQYAGENMGKHKVPTLRNVDKRPGSGFTKAYTHNGFFKSLKEVVHFYNTRDVEPWPPAEVSDNVNTEELGNLELTPEEEDAIVAFMRTLSDGYVIKSKLD